METSNILLKTLKIPSSNDSLNQIETLVDDLCSDLDAIGDNYGNILIALTEAVNNAIQHGNKFDASKVVLINVNKKDNQIILSVKDQGLGFSYENLPDPTAPENIEKECGRGVFLMKSLADDVKFYENGSRVEIYFNL